MMAIETKPPAGPATTDSETDSEPGERARRDQRRMWFNERGGPKRLAALSVTLQDVLEYFDSRSFVPSASISGMPAINNPIAKQSAQEIRTVQLAEIIRCVTNLSTVKRMPSEWNASAIQRLARRHKLGDGEITVGVMGAFGPWRLRWENKGYMEVHLYCQSLSGRRAAAPRDMTQAFREGKHEDEYVSSRTLVDEANTALSLWVAAWGGR